MNPAPRVPEALADLVDGYLADTLEEPQLRQLEAWLARDEAARNYFVRYGQTHTDLFVEARARRAGERAMAAIAVAAEHAGTTPPSASRRTLSPWRKRAALAAALLIATSITWLVAHRASDVPRGGNEVAWLANAQDCQWAVGAGPDGGLTGGRTIRLQRGLAEVHFRSGATIVLEGPAGLQLLSANSAQLLAGRLSARVPEAAKGFQIVAPQGRVVDLGTEFGLAVAEDGSADVIVFKGKVEAYRTGTTAATPLGTSRTARICSAAIVVDPVERRLAASAFTRQIESAQKAIPRTMRLDFRHPAATSLRDSGGSGTGLDHRLPGTGKLLAENDANLRLDTAAGLLEITTTRSDINTQYQLGGGEYLGTRLSSLGFTGREDFEVTAIITNIPSLAAVGQLGLYAGSSSARNIRGGLISRRVPDQYRQFLVNNDGGKDSDSLYVGVLPIGSDVRLSLRRIGGKYSMSVESLTDGSASTLSIRHPEFLDDESDLHVGLFAANTGSEDRRKIAVKEFKATVWTREVRPSE